MTQRNIMKPWLSLVVLGLGLAIVGCDRQADPSKAAASNASPTTAALAQTPAQPSATQREPETKRRSRSRCTMRGRRSSIVLAKLNIPWANHPNLSRSWS